MLRDADSYRDLLDRTAATLDKMEEQLKSGGKERPIPQSNVTSSWFIEHLVCIKLLPSL